MGNKNPSLPTILRHQITDYFIFGWVEAKRNNALFPPSLEESAESFKKRFGMPEMQVQKIIRTWQRIGRELREEEKTEKNTAL